MHQLRSKRIAQVVNQFLKHFNLLGDRNGIFHADRYSVEPVAILLLRESSFSNNLIRILRKLSPLLLQIPIMLVDTMLPASCKTLSYPKLQDAYSRVGSLFRRFYPGSLSGTGQTLAEQH